MKKIGVNVIILVWFCTILAGSCTSIGGSRLMENFFSYMSIGEVKLLLPPQLRTWEVFLDEPGFLVVLVKDYHSLGFVGQLRLVFTDGHLSDTCFFTTNLRQYVTAIEKFNHLRFEPGMVFLRTKIVPHTRVYVNSNFKKEICWYDERFEKMQYSW